LNPAQTKAFQVHLERYRAANIDHQAG
jgi:hypothetical protein